MCEALAPLDRYIATPRVAKHRIFVWLDNSILPDAELVVFARSDDYFFGVLHSSVHEFWARRKGTQLRDAESGSRYSLTYTFDTFPFPWKIGAEPSTGGSIEYQAIANAAEELTLFRDKWLNPADVGVLFSKTKLKKRTLTNLYNALNHWRTSYKGKIHDPNKWDKDVNGIVSMTDIETLDYIHNKLDSSVLIAYGLTPSATYEQIMRHLMQLNIDRRL